GVTGSRSTVCSSPSASTSALAPCPSARRVPCSSTADRLACRSTGSLFLNLVDCGIMPPMSDYHIPHTTEPPRVGPKDVLLIANGDLRLSANQKCWPAQRAMEEALGKAVADCGYRVVRAHPFKENEGHGFISSQKEGMQVFANIDPTARLIVAEAVWQYSHHVLHGLTTHRGPILTAANWSGTWPGLVGMLNLNGSLTKTGVKYSSLWGEDFSTPPASVWLEEW